MSHIILTPAQRKQYRAAAHHLDPVVMISHDGLTPAVLKETDAALNAHGLIKIKVLEHDRPSREIIFHDIAHQLKAAMVQHIGRQLVLWRAQPEKAKTPSETRGAGARTVKVIQTSHRGGQRPTVRLMRVLGNERLTPSGKIKRAKRKKPVSIKKRNSNT